MYFCVVPEHAVLLCDVYDGELADLPLQALPPQILPLQVQHLS